MCVVVHVVISTHLTQQIIRNVARGRRRTRSLSWLYILVTLYIRRVLHQDMCTPYFTCMCTIYPLYLNKYYYRRRIKRIQTHRHTGTTHSGYAYATKENRTVVNASKSLNSPSKRMFSRSSSSPKRVPHRQAASSPGPRLKKTSGASTKQPTSVLFERRGEEILYFGTDAREWYMKVLEGDEVLSKFNPGGEWFVCLFC